MKKKAIIALCVLFSFLFATAAFAASEITVLINGDKAEFDVPPQIIGDRTMVPMRKTFDLLGATIQL